MEHSWHIYSPPISPTSMPSKNDELRLTLAEDCPGCFRTGQVSASQDFDHIRARVKALKRQLDDASEEHEDLRLEVEAIHDLDGYEEGLIHDERLQQMGRALRELDQELVRLREELAVAKLERSQCRQRWARECRSLFRNAE